MEANNRMLRERPADSSQTVNTVMARMIRIAGEALRAKTIEEAGGIIVNRFHTLVKTDRAVLVPLSGRKRISNISGDLKPSQDNSFSQAIHEIRLRFKGDFSPKILNSDELPDESGLANTRKVVGSMGGSHVLWLPLLTEEYRDNGYALWLERWHNKPWTQEEIKLVGYVIVFFERALSNRGRKPSKGSSKKRILIFLAILFCVLMGLPIGSTVKAPVQVIPEKPYYVFAPFEGIIEMLAVDPGQTIQEGDLVFKYDTRVLEKQLEEAQRAVASAWAELTRLEGAGYEDADARAKIPVQKLEVERKEAELDFIKHQLGMATVKTDESGVVLVDDPESLIGSAVQTGEMILRVADPRRTKIRMMVPVTDVGLVKSEATVNIRLDSDPMNNIKANVDRIGFDVELSDDRVPSVIVDGVWANENIKIMPGQRGMAKIDGPKTLLGMQFFRKQLTWVRNTLGI